MLNISTRVTGRDCIITFADLPALRANMCGYADDEIFSGEFHAACWKVIAAIDKARDEDEATHAGLKIALDEFVCIGYREMLLHGRENGTC